MFGFILVLKQSLLLYSNIDLLSTSESLARHKLIFFFTTVLQCIPLFEVKFSLIAICAQKLLLHERFRGHPTYIHWQSYQQYHMIWKQIEAHRRKIVFYYGFNFFMVENEITLGITNWKGSCRICHEEVGIMNIDQDFFFPLKILDFLQKHRKMTLKMLSHLFIWSFFLTVFHTILCRTKYR